MREYAEFLRQPLLVYHFVYMFSVGTGTLQSAQKPIGLTELPAHIRGGRTQSLIRHVVRPQREHLALGARELIAFARRQHPKILLDVTAARLYIASIQWQRRVDDIEVLRIVQEATLRIYFGIHSHPEIYRSFELRRSREQRRVLAERRRWKQNEEVQRKCHQRNAQALGRPIGGLR